MRKVYKHKRACIAGLTLPGIPGQNHLGGARHLMPIVQAASLGASHIPCAVQGQAMQNIDSAMLLALPHCLHVAIAQVRHNELLHVRVLIAF